MFMNEQSFCPWNGTCQPDCVNEFFGFLKCSIILTGQRVAGLTGLPVWLELLIPPYCSKIENGE